MDNYPRCDSRMPDSKHVPVLVYIFSIEELFVKQFRIINEA